LVLFKIKDFFLRILSGFSAQPGVVSKAPVKTAKQLESMTKQQIEAYARKFDIELDRRKTKRNMISDFFAQKS